MDHLEMVEKLREKANVSYEEASAALEQCNWDLLDALLLLESQGRLQEERENAYSTRKEESKKHTERKSRQTNLVSHLLHSLAGVIKKCNAVTVQIKKKDEVRLALPLTAVILLLVFAIWYTLIAAVLGMIFGYRYAISGLTIDTTVNNAMEKAGEFVDNVVKPADVKVVVEDEDSDEPDNE